MKTKQLELEGRYGVFWRVRQSKTLTSKQPTSKMIEGYKKTGEALSGRHLPEKHKQKLSKALIGKPLTQLHKQHMRDNHADVSGEKNGNYGKRGEKAPNYKGGPEKSHTRSEQKRRGFGFIPINKNFIGAEGHHLDKHFVLYIPKDLHRSVYHNVMTCQGMKEINDLAIRYTYGEHEESRW